jgi:hypothetical protein
VPVPFASKTAGTKAVGAVATNPNFAMFSIGDGGRRGIARVQDLAIHAKVALGGGRRQLPSPIMPETEPAISARRDALSARRQRGWRIPGPAIGWR